MKLTTDPFLIGPKWGPYFFVQDEQKSPNSDFDIERPKEGVLDIRTFWRGHLFRFQ